MMRSQMPSFKLSFVIAIALHVLVLGLLFFELKHKPSLRLHQTTVVQMTAPKKVIHAVSVDQRQVEKAIAKIKWQRQQQQQREAQRVASMKQAAQRAAQQQRQAKQRLAQLKKKQARAIQQEKQRLAKLKKQQSSANKHLKQLKQAATAQQKKQKQAALKLAQLKKKQQLAAKKYRDLKKKRLAEKKQKAVEQELQRQLAADQARLTAAKKQQIASQVARYTALIKAVIGENWNVPPGVNKQLACVLLIRLSPSGNVLQVSLVRSSGDAVLDRSAEAAVYKASPLPVPHNKELVNLFKEIRLTVRPEGTLV